ncbi:4Fe-4S single cluster domain-containing protein [Thermomonospora cellulosilytica]|uniref:Anaerobic ribonucleoside-triphosphate reductase activating protein n=1 Tax=Thermomonospora cellulosilytica TaxID=1411118 RepID=A0A7W3MXR2_9ACTN|nr:4Fe-4S single cluster domain-containing protein [Thermomonospora cellulosilytica]MBA9003799.1 anaerobic ribonucleoside-triphosphate reductase activating protein [Thermomonospora cellulosilytica]
MTPPLLLAKAHYPVTTLGPGVRAGIWTQGCTLRCPGCLSRDTWEPDPATAVPVETVLGWLESLPQRPDGITVSGGEPFQQPEALAALLRGIHRWRANFPTDILVYSGYVHSRLSRSAVTRDILDLCDAVITGPYIDRLNPVGAEGGNPAGRSLLWRGSANQRVVPLTALGRERYGSPVGGDGPADAVPGEGGRPRVQVAVDEGPEGRRVYYIGIPRRGDMDRLTSMLEKAGVHAGEVSWRP